MRATKRATAKAERALASPVPDESQLRERYERELQAVKLALPGVDWSQPIALLAPPHQAAPVTDVALRSRCVDLVRRFGEMGVDIEVGDLSRLSKLSALLVARQCRLATLGRSDDEADEVEPEAAAATAVDGGASDDGAAFEQFEVDDILAKWVSEEGVTYFLLAWIGFGPEHNSWEPEENVLDPGLLDSFYLRQAQLLERRPASEVGLTATELREMLETGETAAGEVNDEETIASWARVLVRMREIMVEKATDPNNPTARLLLAMGFAAPLARLAHVLAWRAGIGSYTDPKQSVLLDVLVMMGLVYGAGPIDMAPSMSLLLTLFAVLCNPGRVKFHADVRRSSATVLERILDGCQPACSALPIRSVSQFACQFEQLLAGAKEPVLQCAMLSLLVKTAPFNQASAGALRKLQAQHGALRGEDGFRGVLANFNSLSMEAREEAGAVDEADADAARESPSGTKTEGSPKAEAAPDEADAAAAAHEAEAEAEAENDEADEAVVEAALGKGKGKVDVGMQVGAEEEAAEEEEEDEEEDEEDEVDVSLLVESLVAYITSEMTTHGVPAADLYLNGERLLLSTTDVATATGHSVRQMRGASLLDVASLAVPCVRMRLSFKAQRMLDAELMRQAGVGFSESDESDDESEAEVEAPKSEDEDGGLDVAPEPVPDESREEEAEQQEGPKSAESACQPRCSHKQVEHAGQAQPETAQPPPPPPPPPQAAMAVDELLSAHSEDGSMEDADATRAIVAQTSLLKAAESAESAEPAESPRVAELSKSSESLLGGMMSTGQEEVQEEEVDDCPMEGGDGDGEGDGGDVGDGDVSPGGVRHERRCAELRVMLDGGDYDGPTKPFPTIPWLKKRLLTTIRIKLAQRLGVEKDLVDEAWLKCEVAAWVQQRRAGEWTPQRRQLILLTNRLHDSEAAATKATADAELMRKAMQDGFDKERDGFDKERAQWRAQVAALQRDKDRTTRSSEGGSSSSGAPMIAPPSHPSMPWPADATLCLLGNHPNANGDASIAKAKNSGPVIKMQFLAAFDQTLAGDISKLLDGAPAYNVNGSGDASKEWQQYDACEALIRLCEEAGKHPKLLVVIYGACGELLRNVGFAPAKMWNPLLYIHKKDLAALGFAEFGMERGEFPMLWKENRGNNGRAGFSRSTVLGQTIGKLVVRDGKKPARSFHACWSVHPNFIEGTIAKGLLHYPVSMLRSLALQQTTIDDVELDLPALRKLAKQLQPARAAVNAKAKAGQSGRGARGKGKAACSKGMSDCDSFDDDDE